MVSVCGLAEGYKAHLSTAREADWQTCHFQRADALCHPPHMFGSAISFVKLCDHMVADCRLPAHGCLRERGALLASAPHPRQPHHTSKPQNLVARGWRVGGQRVRGCMTCMWAPPPPLLPPHLPELFCLSTKPTSRRRCERLG